MAEEELNAVAFDALRHLSPTRKASFLLDSAVSLIEAGRYGPEVESYFEVYFKTPGLSKDDLKRAHTARGNARKAAGEALVLKAHQDFEAVIKLDPTQTVLRSHLRQYKELQARPSLKPSQRAPLEVWDRIAQHIPRYHLRTWLFLSSFHRAIASRIIFHTLDIYMSDDNETLYRGLDIFDRAKNDPVFASRVKCLRLHWAYEEGDMLDLVERLFSTALPEFKHLEDFEWVGYPELRADMVQVILKTHAKIHRLGLIGWHFDAVGVSAFTNLQKFTLRAEDDDGFADINEVRTVLDANASTLKHLILGAYLARHHSWDNAFQSRTISHLTHLDLVDTRISHFVLARIAHASNLQSLTLHGTLEDPGSARVVFRSDHVLSDVPGQEHAFLPHLRAFRFLMVGHDDDLQLYEAVTRFVKGRKLMRRLDLGNCPFDMVLDVLPGLPGLRVLGIRLPNATRDGVVEVVKRVPEVIAAVRLSVLVSDVPMHHHASAFAHFPSLSFLHLHSPLKRPKPNMMSDKDFTVQTDIWAEGARAVATTVKSLDFVGWHGEHYVVVRSSPTKPPAPQHQQQPPPHPQTPQPSSSSLHSPSQQIQPPAYHPSGLSSSCEMVVELKELPTRRRLDCGKGVDLGTEDAMWLERKDVPMDYEMPGIE